MASLWTNLADIFIPGDYSGQSDANDALIEYHRQAEQAAGTLTPNGNAAHDHDISEILNTDTTGSYEDAAFGDATIGAASGSLSSTFSGALTAEKWLVVGALAVAAIYAIHQWPQIVKAFK